MASANGTLHRRLGQFLYQAHTRAVHSGQDNVSSSTINTLPAIAAGLHGETASIWIIVYDDTGHFEAHTNVRLPRGPSSSQIPPNAVRRTLTSRASAAGKVKRMGRGGCYGAVLFIEKEGFLPAVREGPAWPSV